MSLYVPLSKGTRFCLKQDTNAYAVLPPSHWKGYREPEEPPAPERGTWGDHPPRPSALEQAVAASKDGDCHRAVIGILDSDPSDGLAGALARLGRAIQGAKTA